MNKLAPYAKAIVGFILPLLTNMAVDLLQGSVPWPQTGAEWLRYLGTSLIVSLGVYGVPNASTPGQITKAAEKTPVMVGEAAAAATTSVVVAEAFNAAEPSVTPAPPSDSSEADAIVDEVLRDNGTT